MRNRQRLRSYSRRAAIREPYDYVLIVCEGSKSEPNYLKGLVRCHQLNSANVVIIPSRGSDPMNVVNHAEEEAQNALRAGMPFDRTYCVFDRDGHANYAQALNKVNNSNGLLRAITSLPCFEVWILQHFSASTAPFTAGGGRSACENVIRAIHNAGFPDYSKDIDDLYDKLLQHVETAITNATHLERHNASNDSSNPATSFHELVQYLRGIKQ